MDWTAFVGRLLIAAIFFISGLSKIPGWEGAVAYATSVGVPAAAVLLFPAIFVETLGGLVLIIGYQAKRTAAILFLYLFIVTLIFHPFWQFQEMERQMQLVNFLKNFAILGGLLEIVAHGPGGWSVDRWLERRRRP